jgi:two-component system chemotaxis sensor kinase CheA
MKGAARAVNMAGIESISHSLESVFALLKRGTVAPSPALLDLCHQAVDTIGKLLASPESVNAIRVRELVHRLEHAPAGPAPSASPPPLPPEPREVPMSGQQPTAETVRIPTGKLDAVLHQAEELLAAKLAAGQRSAELEDMRDVLALWEKEWRKLRPALQSMHKAEQTSPSRTRGSHQEKLLEFLAWNRDFIKSVEYKVHRLARAAATDRHNLDSMVDTLLDGMKGALMLPFTTILESLPKVARDLARDRGKEAELTLEGESVEIDKRILEEIKDPLLHLIRNCVDHGIETPAERQRAGKPPRGKISVITTLLDSNRVEIVVADDGAGIDTARLAKMAVKHGVATPGEMKRMDRDRLLEIIFTSGFSTAPMIDDISGRGLGLAIVREKVEKLDGTVLVKTEPRRGTTFTMLLPLTLSAFRGILVRLGEQQFVVPAARVASVARIVLNAVKTVENRETVRLGDETLSFVRLADVLEIPQKGEKGEAPEVVRLFVLANSGQRIAFGVDDIVGEQEILVKSLGRQLSRVRNISGATVLGTGKVAAILNPGDLMKSAVKVVAAPAVTGYETAETGRGTVLIAEDSITSRTLLKNILETAGYATRTAVDGLDALALLRAERIDLVVSDVDMPRMNGFDLTARIRASKDFSDIPVVLVTSLDSREDRERGIEAGASAYIVKSSFDQSNLLEVIKRLI